MSAAVEQYRGAALRFVLPRMGIVLVSFPGCVADGHHLVAERAREIIDWHHDGGPWPHPWQRITRPAAAMAPAPAQERAAPPSDAGLLGGDGTIKRHVRAKKAGKGRDRELTYGPDGKLRF